MSERVEKWRPIVRSIVQPHLVDTCLALIHVESAGDENAHRPLSQFHGLLQMGEYAGRDVGMTARGRHTTEHLLGDGAAAIQAWHDYVERYRARHGDIPEAIAVLWKGGPGYLQTTLAHAKAEGFDAGVAHASGPHGFSAVEYLRRFRVAYAVYHTERTCPTCNGKGTL